MSDLIWPPTEILERIHKLEMQNAELRNATINATIVQLQLILVLDVLVRAKNLDQEITIGSNGATLRPSERLGKLLDQAFAAVENLQKSPSSKADLAETTGIASRVEGLLGTLATKADLAAMNGTVAALTQRVEGHDRRLIAVEKAITDTIALALSKTLGASSIVGMVAGIAATTAALVGVVAWTLRHFNLG